MQLLNYKNKLFNKTILILFKKIIKLKWFKLNIWLVQLSSTPTNMIPFLKNWNKNQIAMLNDLWKRTLKTWYQVLTIVWCDFLWV
jgi:hypothetical protein